MLFASCINSWAASYSGHCCFINQRRTPSHCLKLSARSSPTFVPAAQLRPRKCECFDLHDKLVLYERARAWQKDIVSEKKALIESGQDCPDAVIVLQHYPVYTMGSSSSEKYLLFDPNDAPVYTIRTGSSEEYLHFDPKDALHWTERGGEVTYHGPGQIVVYPIINLRNHKTDLHWYLRSLEEVVIRTLESTFSIKASRLEGLTGVWVGNQKLAAIGIRVSRWITYHGLALNVTTDLTPFQWIVPCGIQGRGVGSIKELLEESSPPAAETFADDSELMNITAKSLIREFAQVFQLEVHHRSASL
ncbi:hypothetical protein SAY86_011926 [Trapa natans]|uniref:lipoyl(octanoyl) transferase n=1 Tax=Trapa natans TaxID=22666 RepID=A0AAN7LWG3_TRANT|nr:hypothetical protein SAY86_011926 [Trapa natans]